MVVVHALEPSNLTTSSKMDVTSSTLDCPADVDSWVPFYIILFPVFLTGLVGNGLVMFVFLRHKHIRSAPNTLLFSLAVADFTTLLFCATAPAYDFIGRAMPHLCPVLRLVMETAMNVTAFNLVSLSIERYFAIAHPFRNKAASTAFIRRALVSTWLGGLVLSLVKFSLQTPAKCQKCIRMLDTRDLTAVFSVIHFLILYFIPLFVIGVFYTLMAHKLYSSGRSLPEQNETVTRQLEVRKRVALRVLLLVIVYAVGFLPYNFFSMKIYMLEDLTIAEKITPLITILYCIGCTHISINPFVLYFLSKSFRAYFNNYLFCCICKHTEPMDESNSGRKKRDSDKDKCPI